jgi:hypothetical protein
MAGACGQKKIRQAMFKRETSAAVVAVYSRWAGTTNIGRRRLLLSLPVPLFTSS